MDKLPISIKINLPEDQWRAALKEKLSGLTSGCLHALIDMVPEMALPVSKTKCKRACRYTDRWGKCDLVRNPATGHQEWDKEISADFDAVLSTILRTLSPTELLNALFKFEGWITYHFDVKAVTDMDSSTEEAKK